MLNQNNESKGCGSDLTEISKLILNAFLSVSPLLTPQQVCCVTWFWTDKDSCRFIYTSD